MAETNSAVNKEPLVSEAYSTLFHYTTEAGLYGILESQTLWATHFAYLNDSQEIIAAKSTLEKAIYEPLYELGKSLVEKNTLNLKNEITIEELTLQEAKREVELLYKGALQQATPYIFSFCSHHQKDREFSDGLLSQWRGYGSDGGFAIEFESKILEEMLNQDGLTCSDSGFHLSSVVYGENSPDLIYLKDELKILSSIAHQMMAAMFVEEVEEPDLDTTFLPFVKTITRMKHPGFSEESEVRVVYNRPEDHTVLDGNLSGKEIWFRQQSNLRIPYVQLFSEIEEKLPVKRIIVGPHPKASLRKKTLQLYLSQREFDIEVDISSIPYLPK